jgi:LmbE family N-acetylglucosaminyl deacetylase
MTHTASALHNSPLAEVERLPLLPADAALAFGPTLVVAPHPDDESLGCGGAIALLADAGIPVRVLVVTDGTRSHPNSRRFPAPALRALREQETHAALACLGLGPASAFFLGLGDCAVPAPGEPGFAEALDRCGTLIGQFRPASVLLPWRRDPHCDHRATWQLLMNALAGYAPRPRLLEYPIWVWALAEAGDAPEAGETSAWRLTIDGVAARKQAAIAAHRSQTTDLIDDDPEGFRLTPEVLAHFARPWELYLETTR